MRNEREMRCLYERLLLSAKMLFTEILAVGLRIGFWCE